MKLALVSLAVMLSVAIAGAPVSAQERDSVGGASARERSVLPGAPGANRLALDATFLAAAQPFHVDQVTASEGRVAVASGGAADLRLSDASGREVPYLLITPKVEARWRGGSVLRVAPTKLTSGFELDLGSLLPVDRVRIGGLPSPFLKRLRLEGSGDRARWTVLVADGTLFDLPDEGLEHTALEFPAGTYRYLRLTWDDRSSSRMPIPRTVEARVASPVQGPAPLRTAVVVERRASEPGKSRFRIRLPGARLPIIAFELTVSAGNVMRAARITEGRLDGGQVVPTELGTATLRRSVRDGIEASSLRIPIVPPREAQLDLVVDDGDNPPLEVTGATAVFATLPFVYFESADGAPLLARFGNPRLSAPRYDLEAVRDRVSSLHLASARWSTEREAASPTATVPQPLPTGGASIDRQTFRYARAIPLGNTGLATLSLDAAALAHTSLADVRIATPDGHQVPFLVERLDEPLTVALPPLAPAKSSRDAATQSRYRVRLPYAGLPPSRLVLHTDARVFDRRVTVEVEPTSAADARPARSSGRLLLAAETWRHTDPETPAPALALSLPRADAQELFVVIDEGDNAPLPLRDPTLLLPSYRLRFFRDGRTPLTVLYGRPDLGAPRYDLALVAPRLLGAPAEEVTAAGEEATRNVTGITPTIVFWCALAVAVAALLALLARLLRPGDSERAPPASPSSSTASPASGSE